MSLKSGHDIGSGSFSYEWHHFFKPGKLYRRLVAAGYEEILFQHQPIIMFVDYRKSRHDRDCFQALTDDGKILLWPMLTLFPPEEIWEEIQL